MSFAMFDVQTALLYQAPRRFDLPLLAASLQARADEMPVVLPHLDLMPASTDDFAILSGGGVHATIRFQDTPCDPAAFDSALNSPLRHYRSFDYGAAIAAHRAAIIVNVGDGDTYVPLEGRQMMAEMTGMSGADPLYKLATLHMILQAVTDLARPVVVDFCPTMTLLRPEEYEHLAGQNLPYDLLYHPYPEDGGTTPDGKALIDFTLFRSDELIGRTLVLEGIPVDFDLEAVKKIATGLIQRKAAGVLELANGETVELAEGLILDVRHQPSADGAGKPTIHAKLTREGQAAAPRPAQAGGRAPVAAAPRPWRVSPSILLPIGLVALGLFVSTAIRTHVLDTQTQAIGALSGSAEFPEPVLLPGMTGSLEPMTGDDEKPSFLDRLLFAPPEL